jgi:hypothetical protein
VSHWFAVIACGEMVFAVDPITYYIAGNRK